MKQPLQSKRSFATLAALILATASGANGALIGAWLQNEPSGDLIDSTGGHPAGVATGTPTYGQPGVPAGTYGSIVRGNIAGSSIDYGPSISDEFFNVGADNNNPVMNLDAAGSFTAMGWVNPSAPTAALFTYRFLSTGSAAGADRGWGLGLRLNQATGVASDIRFTSYGILDNDSSTFDVAFGSWIHLAVTYNNGTINYFLNGNALDSDTSVFGNELAAARLVIGGRLGANDVDQMNGRIDEVKVYNTVLSLAEIQAAAVPEPSSAILGMIALAGLARRRRA